MTERGNEKIVLTGVTPEEIQVALGYLGVSGYSIEVVPAEHEIGEQPRLGYATKNELVSFAEKSPNYDHLQTPGGLWARLRSHRALEQGKIPGYFVGQKEPLELFRLIPREGELPEEAINLDTLSLMLGARSLEYVPYVGKKMERFTREFLASRQASLEAAERQETAEGPKLGYASQDELTAFAASHSGHGAYMPTRFWYALWRTTDRKGNIRGSDIYRYQEESIELFKEFRVDGKPPELKMNVDTLSAMITTGALQAIPNFGIKTEWFARDFVASRQTSLEETDSQQ